MDVFSAIAGRRSVRTYRDADVEPWKIEKILEAGRLSPSASNRQEWRFIVVRDESMRRQLAVACKGQAFVGTAPVVIVACAAECTAVMPCGQPAYTVDVSIAFAYMILEAFELGLGSCWIGAFDEEAVKTLLDVPKEARVVAVSPFGYPDHPIPPRPRKRFDEVVFNGKWGQP